MLRIDQNKDKIISMLSQGISAYKMAQILPHSKTCILRFIEREGLTNQNKSSVNRDNLLKDKLDTVIRLHNSGLNHTQIAKQIGHSQSSVRALLLAHGHTNINANYNVDETFFNQIDTEEKAYILGWFYSDGCVENSGKCRIQIQKEDEHILYRIKDILGYDGPLYDIPPPKKFPHRKPQTCLCINRKALADDLIKWGCLPNKSLILEYPKWINPELEHHFVRGVFDGDGSVSARKGKYLCVGITTTDTFNIELQSRLAAFGIDSQYYYRRKGKNTCSLMTTKHKHSVRLLDYIYKDSSIHLNRKYEKYRSFI